MEIRIFENSKQLAEEASKIIQQKIKKKPSLVLGLAAGKTVIPLYRQLVKLYKNKKINFSKITTFNLDECLDSTNKNIFKSFMEEHLFKKINIKKSNIHSLDCNSKDLKKECQEYERKIKKSGGIDLQILGIGVNGHMAFNEPGSSFNSNTRKVKLTKTTIINIKKVVDLSKSVQRYALTMGIKTIMESKKIILLAAGKHKATAIHNLIQKKITKKTPASVLRRHKNLMILIDKYSASKI